MKPTGAKGISLTDNTPVEPATMPTFYPHPIIGQEAICPDGLGIVIAYNSASPESWVQVKTYVNNRECKWDYTHVTLIDPGVRVRLTSEEEDFTIL